MKILVFGTGGVGGLIGAILSVHGGHEVAFVARGEHAAAMRQTARLQVHSEALGSFSVVDPHIIENIVAKDAGGISDRSAQFLREMELVLVCCKTWQLSAASESLLALLRLAAESPSKPLVLPLLNGVTAADDIASIASAAGVSVPAHRVLRGFCTFSSFIDAPGVIRHLGERPVVGFGPSDPGLGQRNHFRDVVEPLAARLQADATGSPLADSILSVRAAADIRPAQWAKFMFIASVGAISSLTGMPAGYIRTVPATLVLVERAMREVGYLARLEGVAGLDVEATVSDYLELMDRMPTEWTTSMQRDFAAGRRTELEAMSGYVVRCIRDKHGGDTGEGSADAPVHDTAYRLLLLQDLQAQGRLASGGLSALRVTRRAGQEPA